MLTWPGSEENLNSPPERSDRAEDRGSGWAIRTSLCVFIVSGSSVYALPFSIAGWPPAASSLSVI